MHVLYKYWNSTNFKNEILVYVLGYGQFMLDYVCSPGGWVVGI